MSWARWLAGLAGALVVLAAGDVASEEIRARLDRLPFAVLRLARSRLPAELRERVHDQEWAPELRHVLHDAELFPITRLLTGLRFAAGLLIRATTIAAELRPEGTARDSASRASSWRQRLASRSARMLHTLIWPVSQPLPFRLYMAAIITAAAAATGAAAATVTVNARDLELSAILLACVLVAHGFPKGGRGPLVRAGDKRGQIADSDRPTQAMRQGPLMCILSILERTLLDLASERCMPDEPTVGSVSPYSLPSMAARSDQESADEIRYLTYDHILVIHNQILIVRNGVREDPTILEPSLLQSVPIRPQTHYCGVEQYPGLFVKAAVLLDSLAGAQLFFTGNKRTGWEAARVFLGWNGYRVATVTSREENEARKESIGRFLDQIGSREIADVHEIATKLQLYFEHGRPARGRYRPPGWLPYQETLIGGVYDGLHARAEVFPHPARQPVCRSSSRRVPGGHYRPRASRDHGGCPRRGRRSDPIPS